ncbi:hypothetical protein [Agromyces sp. Soil535]|uniref:hypothetical protein n=1 Tax=Agromyces sp. Soil535 TaxID=1736390 RepID=UPI0006F4570F|nr:hypothetical protein [Agromyces sp. Soil535]KRE21732.1 hypothetical protein ASG80_11550 [Agromyces sp. Soil535]
MNAIERSIRALERIAYGADSTDAERARATAELAELTGPASLDADRDAVTSTGPAEARVEVASRSGIADVAAGEAVDEHMPADDAGGRARRVRWAAVAAGVGLVVGAVLGWAAGQRVPPELVSSSTIGPTSSAGSGTPLDETDLLPLFDRLPLAAEAARVTSVDAAIDQASVRQLASRTDGPTAYLARTVDGDDVCLVLLLPTGPSRHTCTIDGRFPDGGLSIQYDAQGYGLALARLSQAGTVALGLIVSF